MAEAANTATEVAVPFRMCEQGTPHLFIAKNATDEDSLWFGDPDGANEEVDFFGSIAAKKALWESVSADPRVPQYADLGAEEPADV
jgi:hypothetical protein